MKTTQSPSSDRLDLPRGTCAALAKEINAEGGDHRMTPNLVWNKIHQQRDPEMMKRAAAYVKRVKRERERAEKELLRALENPTNHQTRTAR